MKDILLGVVAVVALGVVAAAWFVTDQEKVTSVSEPIKEITSFVECEAAGNPVMESYPRQCAASGQTFVEIIPEDVTVIGEQVCLEKRAEVDAAVTLECALGFETDDGRSLALDIPEELLDKIPMKTTVKLSGTLVPVESLSHESWQQYDIAGVLTVANVMRAEAPSESEAPYRSLPPAEQEPIAPTPEDPVTRACYVGGCSSQVCSDSPDVVTTCEWREEYACYGGAVCERQDSGKCGWTYTDEVKACFTEKQTNATL